jgi:HSP20 family protein
MSRYEPWSLLQQVERGLSQSQRGLDVAERVEWSPPVDLVEEAERYVLLVDVPGVGPRDIEMTMEKHLLVIKGERGAVQEGLKRRDRVSGRFYRGFSLPETADADAITARCEDGVLEIAIPKKTLDQPRKIEVLAKVA